MYLKKAHNDIWDRVFVSVRRELEYSTLYAVNLNRWETLREQVLRDVPVPWVVVLPQLQEYEL